MSPSNIVDKVGVTTSVESNNILCVLSNSSGYSVLFFQPEPESEPDRVYLKKIELDALPTELSPLLTDIPSHLCGDTAIHVVISTGSGTGKAETVYEDAIHPFFTYLGIHPLVHRTEDTHTITNLARDHFLESAHQGRPQTIILLSGDGGLADVLDVFYRSQKTINVSPNVVLIPCGTGNAMASSIESHSGPLPSLATLVHGTSSPLPVVAAKFSPGSRLVVDEGRLQVPIDPGIQDAPGVCPILWGAVVASWGFHATLVADSDTAEYRKFGAERFHLVAKELLYPPDGSPSHRFKGKITMTTSARPDDSCQVAESEHMYALATLVPRLEKNFLISPDSKPLSGKMRFLHFGPMPPEDAMELIMLAYQGADHVKKPAVTYEEIETLRIDFQEDEQRWRRVCIDGKIVAVESDGWVELRIEPSRLLKLIH